MFKKFAIYLSFVLILSLLLVACGGDDEEATTEPEAVTEEEAVTDEEAMAEPVIVRITTWAGVEEAAELQRRMVPVNAAVTARFGIAGLKAALDMLGYYGGPVRAPLLNLTGSELQALQATMVERQVL